MAEFLEVITKVQAMCDESDCCDSCPLSAINCSPRYLALEKLKEFEEVVVSWEKPVDWSKVEVDTKILVRNHKDSEWVKKYFAKYADGKVYAFSDGRTSWNTNVKIPWNFAKLWEGEE